ncbi:MAG TPA: hypothetical protein VLG47_07350 [Candidatus Saccharimonadales bacterium]|nr:hypothetical protein [Candidatus Saccharimonadales bacterium]
MSRSNWGGGIALNAKIHESAFIDTGVIVMSEAEIGPRVSLGSFSFIGERTKLLAGAQVLARTHIHEDVQIGEDDDIGADTTIHKGSYFESDVTVGPEVSIGAGALILAGAVVCPNFINANVNKDNEKMSKNAREIEECVTIGPNVVLPDQVEIGFGAIIPTQRTIAYIGSFGDKNRFVTIYGSDTGPCYSVGCQIGIDFTTFCTRVANKDDTTNESAATYVPYLDVFNLAGLAVQNAYDAERRFIDELKDQRVSLSM